MELLKANPAKIFYRYLFPAVSAAVAIAIYSFVDTIVIGQAVGPIGTAACAIVLPCFTIAHCIDLNMRNRRLCSDEQGERRRK